MCKSSPAGMLRASVTIEGQNRLVEDYFDMAFANRHHNWGGDYLIIFEEPIDSFYGLTWDSSIGTDSQIHYLDADFNFISTRQVVEVVRKEEW